MNFHEKKSESSAREQPPDLIQGSWRWFKFKRKFKSVLLVAKVHLGRMVHHTSWKTIKETLWEKQRSAKISIFCDVCFLVLSMTNFLNRLQISHQSGHTEVILEENMSFYQIPNYLLPGSKSDTWTFCQSFMCDALVRTIDLFLWFIPVLSYHQAQNLPGFLGTLLLWLFMATALGKQTLQEKECQRIPCDSKRERKKTYDAEKQGDIQGQAWIQFWGRDFPLEDSNNLGQE